MRMKEGTKIADHLNVFNTLIYQLSSMDVKIDDEDKSVNILCTLLESWGQVVSSISLSTTDTLEFDNVVGALLSEELRKKTSLETSSPEALVVRGHFKDKGENSRGNSSSNSKGKNSKLKCWYHKKTGHLKKYCWKRQESKKDDSKSEANLVKSFDSGMIDEVLSACNISKCNEEWLLDSGAMHHICPRKYWFASYQTVNDGIVLLGDNHSCKIVGVGSVKIKMFDGVIRTLTDVRHVPELKKKLISLGVLAFLWS